MQDTPESHADAVRGEILRHAGDLFHHYGYAKTNIGDIAKRCEMSPGNLYRYFRNKQAIGCAVVESHFRASEAEMGTALLLPGAPEERIRAMMRGGVGYIAREMDASPRIIELADFLCDDQNGLVILQDHIQWKRAHIAVEIARGIEAGDFRATDPVRTASAILNATKAFWTPMTLANWRDRPHLMEHLEDVLDLLFSGLRATA